MYIISLYTVIPNDEGLRALRRFFDHRTVKEPSSDFFEKTEAVCQFFDKRGYSVSVVQAGHHRAQQIDRHSALQTAEKEHTDRIPFSFISPSQPPGYIYHS